MKGIMKKVVKLGQANWNGSHGWKSFYEQNALHVAHTLWFGLDYAQSLKRTGKTANSDAFTHDISHWREGKSC